MYIYIYTYIYVHLSYTYIQIYVCMYICIYTSIYTYVYALYIHLLIHMYMHIFTYIHLNTQRTCAAWIATINNNGAYMSIIRQIRSNSELFCYNHIFGSMDTLQHTATHGNTLQHAATHSIFWATYAALLRRECETNQEQNTRMRIHSKFRFIS